MEFLKTQALQNPHKLCINNLTYGEVYKEVLALALKLEKRLGSLNRVALLSENSVPMVLILYALFLLKKEVLTLNIQLTNLEIQKQVQDLGIDKIIISDKFIEKKTFFPDFLQFSTIFHEKCLDIHDHFTWEMPKDQIVAIMNTSATTGQFKSVPIAWGQILSHAKAQVKILGQDPKDNWLVFLPIFHVSGLMILFRSLYNGTSVSVMEKYVEDEVLAKITSKEINMISIVPSLLSRIVDKIKEHSLRVILLGGEFIPVNLVEKCQKKSLPLYKTYGMTDHVSQICTFNIMEHKDKITSVGRPLPGVKIQIRNILEDNIGEIWIKSPMLMNGYLNYSGIKYNDDFFNTDDYGYMDHDDFLYVVNRRKDLIISGGENIYPKEIEDLLYGLAQVEECAIIGKADEKWGQVPILHLVSSLKNEEIMDYLAKNLAKYKLPKQIIYHQELPKNSTGKILRAALKDMQ